MERIDMESILRENLPFWEKLSDYEKEYLASSAKLYTYDAGIVIHHSTDSHSPGIQIVRSGRARVYISSQDGKQFTMHRILDNEMFVIGFGCLFDNVIIDVALETETPCEILLLPRKICRQICDENPLVKIDITSMLASRFSRAVHLLESVTFLSLKSRLANALIEHSALAGSHIFKATHAGIAGDIGATRETVTRLLNEFQDGGLILLQRGRIRIEDMAALMEIRGNYYSYMRDEMIPDQYIPDEFVPNKFIPDKLTPDKFTPDKLI